MRGQSWQTGLPYSVSLPVEIQLQGKLDLPCGCGSVRPGQGLDGQSKGSRVLNHVARLTKLGVIEYVEELGADLHPEASAEADIFQ